MFSQKKPFTAVSVNVENLTSESYSVDDLSGIPDLVEVIKLQASGPGEAARTIRKKLKYGNVHRQLCALVLLDGLIQNASSHFQRAFADEPLLERLRVCGTSSLADPAVRRKCDELFREWAQYASTPGLERVARLHRELPKRKVAVTQERSRVIQETENPFGDDKDDNERLPAATPSTAAPKAGKKDKSKGGKAKGGSRRRPFDLEAEKDKMKAAIAEASIASTNLMNALQSINCERERISDNRLAVHHFEACKQLRRCILRYIHHVESEQWLGSLLHVNDELVHALMSFEQLNQSIDADSDSDDELAEQAHLYRMAALMSKEDQPAVHPPSLSGLSLDPAAVSRTAPAAPARPPRKPVAEPALSDDDDGDPFGDKNVVETPAHEREEPRW